MIKSILPQGDLNTGEGESQRDMREGHEGEKERKKKAALVIFMAHMRQVVNARTHPYAVKSTFPVSLHCSNQ